MTSSTAAAYRRTCVGAVLWAGRSALSLHNSCSLSPSLLDSTNHRAVLRQSVVAIFLFNPHMCATPTSLLNK